MAVKTITVTITDKTQGPFNLLSLLRSGNVSGATVVPSAGNGASLFPCCSYLCIQAAEGNGAGKIFVGDENVAADGSRQGKVLLSAESDTKQRETNIISLNDKYVNTDTNNSVFSVEVDYL